MDIEKANYATIVKIGSLQDLLNKLKLEEKRVSEIVSIVDNHGVSLLQKSLSARKFDIAKFLLSNGAQVNIISNDGNNEFHYLAANINCQGALEIAYLLLDKGTSVMQKDLKYGNTAFFTLSIEAFKQRSDDTMQFIQKCFEHVNDVDEENRSGYSIRKLISERGPESLKRMLEDKNE